MAKGKVSKKTAKDIEATRERRRQNKLLSIKHAFEAGQIKNFEQVFAIMSESRVAKELGIGFTTFRNKVESPGDFTLNDLKKLAELFKVEFDVILHFIKELMRPTRSKAK